MRNLTPEIIASVTGGKYSGSADASGCEISFITTDSRLCGRDCLFAAITGEHADGHDYIASAAGQGALCVLSEHGQKAENVNHVLVKSTLSALCDIAEYYRAQFELPVVGVIGSVGKTTAKDMIAAVLSQRFNTLKTEGNFNNELGVPLTLFRLMPEHEAAVIEMGISDFGEMTRLSKMARPNICLMTAIGHCHLEKLGDLRGVLRAKSEVFEFMRPDSVAVINGDDELLKSFEPGLRKVMFGLGRHCGVRAENVESRGIIGTDFDIVAENTGFHVSVPAFGSHIVLSALSAAAVGLTLGLSSEEITRGLGLFEMSQGRANIIDTGYIKIIDDCYNANPTSVSSALHSLCSLPGRRVAILGDMLELGNAQLELHREIGTLAGHCGIDSLICCGPLSAYICEGFADFKKTGYHHFAEKGELLSALPSLIEKQDTVLVKASHGMRFDEIVHELQKLK